MDEDRELVSNRPPQAALGLVGGQQQGQGQGQGQGQEQGQGQGLSQPLPVQSSRTQALQTGMAVVLTVMEPGPGRLQGSH